MGPINYVVDSLETKTVPLTSLEKRVADLGLSLVMGEDKHGKEILENIDRILVETEIGLIRYPHQPYVYIDPLMLKKAQEDGIDLLQKCDPESYPTWKVWSIFNSDPDYLNIKEHYNPSNRGHLHVILDSNGCVVGSAGLRSCGMDVAGFSKFYLLPEIRGKGLGKLLMEDTTRVAKEFGYKKIESCLYYQFKASKALHEKMGFKEVEPSEKDKPWEGLYIFMELDL